MPGCLRPEPPRIGRMQLRAALKVQIDAFDVFSNGPAKPVRYP
jgi:hypothetical protein